MKQSLDKALTQLARGDREALRQVWELSAQPVYAYALSVLRDPHAAEDVLQDTMLRCAANVLKYRPGTNAKAWLFRIARNLCIDSLRRADNRTVPLEDSAAALLTDSADIARETELKQQLEAALAVLSEQEREIVLMYAVAGLSQGEIAGALELPYVLVRSRYAYALKKLRRALDAKM